MILQNRIVVYHAGYIPIKKIDLSLCSVGKDFGKGFYTTTDYNQACKFVKVSIKKAIKNGIKLSNPSMGYITAFNFANSEEKISVFEFNDANREWLHCVAGHRNHNLVINEKNIWTNYDIIAGKIANDATNQVITAYINGLYGEVGSDLADETAIRLLLPNKLSNQICFKTEAAIRCLTFAETKEFFVEEHQ